MPSEAMLRHLAALYAADSDPWGHATRLYEKAKHRTTLAAIGRGPFRQALEVGCGIGPLTDRLSSVCGELTALDCVPAAIAQARSRVRRANVTFVEAAAPAGLPEGSFDLVVLSEVLYFLERDEIDRVAAWLARCAAQGCRVVSVNWTGPTGHALSGREAADRLVAGLAGWHVSRFRHVGYDLDVCRAASR